LDIKKKKKKNINQLPNSTNQCYPNQCDQEEKSKKKEEERWRRQRTNKQKNKKRFLFLFLVVVVRDDLISLLSLFLSFLCSFSLS
jgi:hypothetical protein